MSAIFAYLLEFSVPHVQYYKPRASVAMPPEPTLIFLRHSSVWRGGESIKKHSENRLYLPGVTLSLLLKGFWTDNAAR